MMGLRVAFCDKVQRSLGSPSLLSAINNLAEQHIKEKRLKAEKPAMEGMIFPKHQSRFI